MMERLDGKRIIITGGAGGMGRTTVENFPSLGAKVAFFDVNDTDGAEVEKSAEQNLSTLTFPAKKKFRKALKKLLNGSADLT